MRQIVLCLGAWLAAVASSHAQSPLAVDSLQPKQIRVDGELGDWRGARFSRIGQRDDGRAEVALGFDADGLYLAARVFDDHFVRSSHPNPREDALVFRFALPSSNGWQTKELWMFAGKTGETRARLQLMAAGSNEPIELDRPAQIVEAPMPQGYSLETFVPWTSLDVGRHRAYLFARGEIRLHDVDRAGASGRDGNLKSGAELPWLSFHGGPLEAMRAFLSEKNLGSGDVRFDRVDDLHRDGALERIVVAGTYLLLSGTSAAFTFSELPVARASDILSSQLLDTTGDDRPELVLRFRARDERAERELWSVFDLQAATPRSIFTVESRVRTPAGAIDANVSIAGKPPLISIRTGKAHGLSASDDIDPHLSDRVAIPTPWGEWMERTYAWDGRRFAIHSERANPRAEPASSREAPPPVESTPHESEPAPATTAALIDAYRSARGLPADSASRFNQRVNLADDARPESLALFGRECVVVGEGFRGGRDFFYFGLPAHDGNDVLRLFTGDLTGDGRHELLARIRQQIGDVTREILYVYTFSGERLEPLLAVEVSRSRGAQNIANQVALVPARGHVALQIAPGAAHGWSESDYPFSSDSKDGVAPLLLPWKDRPLRYEFDGQQLVPRVTNP